MTKIILRLFLVFILFASPISVFCADDNSRFFLTTADKAIFGTCPTAVLSYTLTLDQAKTVLVAANGRYYPVITNGIAVVNIRIDGNEWYGSHSTMDWTNTSNAVQHSFDCIALATLQPGTHLIELVGFNHVYTPSASFVIGGYSGLSVMTNPAPNFLTSTLNSDSQIIDHETQAYGNTGDIPATTLLSNSVYTDNPTNVVTMLSGRAYCAGGQGDALWGIYLNDQCPQSSTSNLTVNDLFNEAELGAPMYCFAMHTITGNNTISFKASELTWVVDMPNLVQYRVGQDARLITLWGMGVSGSAVLSNESCRRDNWVCSQTSTNYNPPHCPATGTNYTFAETTINIPNGHNGVVFIKTATRLQGADADAGGDVKLWLNIDGEDVGTVGVQQLKAPNCLSSRTIVASYLATGDKRLTPGAHVVRAYIKATGSFNALAVARDLPLVYFD
ncbi:hypothetical protein [Niastella sp. OAS944]|uniref:hypothetical protein n=1 Tax=Niastella sp. OAS944 TaxID=2664089 RepID=UPI003479C3B5|nr:hypothetical protein [Chitinophagaceae bacterium OAS944]